MSFWCLARSSTASFAASMSAVSKAVNALSRMAVADSRAASISLINFGSRRPSANAGYVRAMRSAWSPIRSSSFAMSR